MDMEERHDQQSAVLERQFIRSLDVLCLDQLPFRKNTTRIINYALIVLVRFP